MAIFDIVSDFFDTINFDNFADIGTKFGGEFDPMFSLGMEIKCWKTEILFATFTPINAIGLMLRNRILHGFYY